jgi:hypothetical protein
MHDDLIDAFVRDGFVKVEQAFPAEVADACETLLWDQIEAERDDPATWTRPVYWVGDMPFPPFVEAANTPVLHDAFDTLVGPGRWSPRTSLGSFPLRFPHAEEPDDAGWHIDSSFQPPGETEWWANIHSAWRALLMLFLFTDVDPAGAPTRVRVGSHMDVAPILHRYGDEGAPMSVTGPLVDAATTSRPVVAATGRAGDVYLCHPFLVHAAQPHHGSRPRFISQPPLHPAPSCMLTPFEETSPVGRTIRQALGS